MRSLYFSGFCLQNEVELFERFIINNDYTVTGFSYGAIEAIQYVSKTKHRIDTLQLFSPAFFNDKDLKYKRKQLIYFAKNPFSYANNFLSTSGLNNQQISKYLVLGSKEQLNTLLYYQWDHKILQKIIDRGIKIEVYLGSNDKIINAIKTKDFLLPYSQIYFIQYGDHILCSP